MHLIVQYTMHISFGSISENICLYADMQDYC